MVFSLSLQRNILPKVAVASFFRFWLVLGLHNGSTMHFPRRGTTSGPWSLWTFESWKAIEHISYGTKNCTKQILLAQGNMKKIEEELWLQGIYV